MTHYFELKLLLKRLMPVTFIVFTSFSTAQANTVTSVRQFDSIITADYTGIILKESGSGSVLLFYTDYEKFLRASENDEIDVWGVKENKVRNYNIGPPTTPNKSFKEKKSAFLSAEEIKPATDWEYRYIFATYDNTIDSYKGDGDTDHYSRKFQPWLKSVAVDLRVFNKNAAEISATTLRSTGRQVIKVGDSYVLVTPGSPYKVNGVLSTHSITNIIGANDLASQVPERKFIALTYYSRTSDIYDKIQNGDLTMGAKFSDPIRPFIIADYDLSDEGVVLKGKAMCVADCPSGKLFKLLTKGQNIFK